MKREIWLYGLGMGCIIFVLSLLEYHYVIKDISVEILTLIIALIFTAVGIWFGWNWRSLQLGKFKQLPKPTRSDAYQLSDRELEVLQKISLGKSNQEIADELFLSIHTVKSHVASLFQKLDVKRRTQAVQKARESSILE